MLLNCIYIDFKQEMTDMLDIQIILRTAMDMHQSTSVSLIW